MPWLSTTKRKRSKTKRTEAIKKEKPCRPHSHTSISQKVANDPNKLEAMNDEDFFYLKQYFSEKLSEKTTAKQNCRGFARLREALEDSKH